MDKITNRLLAVLVVAVIASSCNRYRDIEPENNFTPPPTGVLTFGSLRINEFCCKNPNNADVIGTASKWFELYNPTGANILLDSGKWYVTDTLGIPDKYNIPAPPANKKYWTIPAKGFLCILCPKTPDLQNPDRINTTFSLNSTNGHIGIFYKPTPTSNLVAIDTVRYDFSSIGGSPSGTTYGRRPDGSGGPYPISLSKNTPEASNN